MKNFIVFTTLVMASSMAQADMVKHEYIESAGGPNGCTMPINIAEPKEGDCFVKKGVIETGSVITGNGLLCIETVTELVAMNHIKTGTGLEIDLPNVNVMRHPIGCPSAAVVENSTCPVNGLVAVDVHGLVLRCQTGKWKF